MMRSIYLFLALHEVFQQHYLDRSHIGLAGGRERYRGAGGVQGLQAT